MLEKGAGSPYNGLGGWNMPNYCDYHMHSHHSLDAAYSVREMAEAAVRAGLAEICFTDHVEFEDPECRDEPADIAALRAEIARERPSLSVRIRCGVEIGLSPEPSFAEQSMAWAGPAKPDFIIGSVHRVGEENVYHQGYFTTRERDAAYAQYAEALAASIPTLPQLSVLGHFDFVAKRAPYAARRVMRYADAPEAFDSVLRYLAENGKGMEVNTAAWQDDPAWGLDVLSRFVELGGEFVTFGSDAHTPERVGKRLVEARALALAAGVHYTATFHTLEPRFIKIEA